MVVFVLCVCTVVGFCLFLVLFFLWEVTKYSCSSDVDVCPRVVGEGGCVLGQALVLWILLPMQSPCEIGGVSADSWRDPKVRNGAKHSNLDQSVLL